MITRQHFEAFAKEINAIDSQAMRQEFAIISSRIFGHFNPNFNRCKYLEACGYYTGKKQHKYENITLNREIA
jgi:hypothetical protein